MGGFDDAYPKQTTIAFTALLGTFQRQQHKRVCAEQLASFNYIISLNQTAKRKLVRFFLIEHNGRSAAVLPVPKLISFLYS